VRGFRWRELRIRNRAGPSEWVRWRDAGKKKTHGKSRREAARGKRGRGWPSSHARWLSGGLLAQKGYSRNYSRGLGGKDQKEEKQVERKRKGKACGGPFHVAGAFGFQNPGVDGLRKAKRSCGVKFGSRRNGKDGRGQGRGGFNINGKKLGGTSKRGPDDTIPVKG